MPMYVNAKAMANIMDLSERRINQLVSEGVVMKEADGNYNVMQVIMDYYKNKSGLDTKVNYEVEHALLEKAKRESAEIDLALLKNEIHKGEDIRRIMSGMLITFRNKILAIPSTVSSKLVKQKNPAVIIDILTKEFKVALRELSEYDPEMFTEDE